MLVLSGLDPISDPRADVLTSEGTELGQDAVIPNSMPGWPDTSSVVGARLCDYAVIVSSGAAPTIASDDGVFVGVSSARRLRAPSSRGRSRRCAPRSTSAAFASRSLSERSESKRAAPFCRRRVEHACRKEGG